jgi:hypothetical protein
VRIERKLAAAIPPSLASPQINRRHTADDQ